MTQEEKAKSYDGILTATNFDKKFQYCKVPKFKVGDYIKHNKVNIICKVISVNSCYYYVENVATGGGIELFNAEQNFHLWTIQDAKDGDVLAVNGKPFICYHPDEYRSNYCCIDDKGCFRTNIRFSFEGNCILPATKEQRDFLFQKMKETGYEWDEDKKELRTINNALEECEIEHIEHGKYYYCIKDYYSGGCKRASKGEVVQALRGMSMMALGVKANEYFIPVKCIVNVSPAQDFSPAWSEEDKKILNGIIEAGEHHCQLNIEETNWLKSLKQRMEKKMKAYTDINQSKKLTEILPIESADMTYCAITDGVRERMIIKNWQVNIGLDIAIKENLFSYRNGYMIPCWSLAALLSMLPSGKALIHDQESCKYKCSCKNIDTDFYDNSIDACYEMILKLHEQKIL